MKKLLPTLLLFVALGAKSQARVDNNPQSLKDTAQRYIDRFITALGKNTPGYRFMVKSDFVENGVHEHLWSQVKVYSNGVFKGIFIDSPMELRDIKTGDKVSIKKSGVEDWAIFDRKGLHVDGNFSDKYLKMQKL